MPSIHRAQQRGFTYLEVMIATVLIAIMLVPAMEALTPAIQGSAMHKQHAEIHYALLGKLEQVLAKSFDELDAAAAVAGAHTNATSYSDPAANVPDRVFIWRYDIDDADSDGDVFTDGEDDLLWVKVATEDASQSLQTLISRY